ncbi:hypothetical protein E3Q02_00162 [Wallemia mellicola]|uniref:Exocyst complex component Sec8 n=1 Tax=Wallemia mellicola TaxID=1708541 RepID=A0AB38N1E9_9BASI|nr:hypothetical protein E3Q02_00162 [Wallemia mellicola]
MVSSIPSSPGSTRQSLDSAAESLAFSRASTRGDAAMSWSLDRYRSSPSISTQSTGFNALSTVLNHPNKRPKPLRASRYPLPAISSVDLRLSSTSAIETYLEDIQGEYTEFIDNINQSAASTSAQPESDLPSLDDIPRLFFKPDFDLGDPATFAAVTKSIGDSAGLDIFESPEDIGINEILHSRLEHHANAVDKILVHELSQRAPSLFSALDNLQHLGRYASEALEKFNTLRELLESSIKSRFETKYKTINGVIDQRNLEEILTVITDVKSISQALLALQQMSELGHYFDALELVENISKTVVENIRSKDVDDILKIQSSTDFSQLQVFNDVAFDLEQHTSVILDSISRDLADTLFIDYEHSLKDTDHDHQELVKDIEQSICVLDRAASQLPKELRQLGQPEYCDFLNNCKEQLKLMVKSSNAQKEILESSFDSSSETVSNTLERISNRIIEEVYSEIASVIRLRKDIEAELSLEEYLAFDGIVWKFINETEVQGNVPSNALFVLPAAASNQLQEFLELFHANYTTQSAKLVEMEIWSQAEVTPAVQHVINMIIRSAVDDIPESSYDLSNCEGKNESAGAMRSAGLKNITAKHLALASQSLSVMISLIPYIREAVRRRLKTNQATLLIEFDRLKRDYQEHQYEIHAKLVSILGDRLTAHSKALAATKFDRAKEEEKTKPNSYAEGLVKETATLHRVLNKYLLEATVQFVFKQVFDAINKRIGDYYQRLPIKTELGKEKLMTDARFLCARLNALQGIDELGTSLIDIANNRQVSKSSIDSPRPSMSIEADQMARRSMSVDLQRRESLDKSRMSIGGTSSQDNVLKIDESVENVDISAPQEEISMDKKSQDGDKNKESATANISQEAQNNVESDQPPQQQVKSNDEVVAGTGKEVTAEPASEPERPSEFEQPVESASTSVKPEGSIEADKPVESVPLSEPEHTAESEKPVESIITEPETEKLERTTEFAADEKEVVDRKDSPIARTEEVSISGSQKVENTDRTTESAEKGDEIMEASQKEPNLEANNDVTEGPENKDETNEDAKDVKKNDQKVTEVGAKSDIKEEIKNDNNNNNSNNEENSDMPMSAETENSSKTKPASSKAKSKNQKKKNKKGKKGFIRQATTGTVLSIAAIVIFAIVSFNAPLIKQLYFVQVTTTIDMFNAKIILGTLGYCVYLEDGKSCIEPTLGYNIKLEEVGLTDFLQLQQVQEFMDTIPQNVLKWVTYVFVLNFISLGLSFFTVLIGIFSHIRELGRSYWSSFISILAAVVALATFAFDMAFAVIIRNKFNELDIASAEIGQSVWLVLAAAIALVISVFMFLTGIAMSRRQHKTRDLFESEKDKNNHHSQPQNDSYGMGERRKLNKQDKDKQDDNSSGSFSPLPGSYPSDQQPLASNAGMPYDNGTWEDTQSSVNSAQGHGQIPPPLPRNQSPAPPFERQMMTQPMLTPYIPQPSISPLPFARSPPPPMPYAVSPPPIGNSMSPPPPMTYAMSPPPQMPHGQMPPGHMFPPQMPLYFNPATQGHFNGNSEHSSENSMSNGGYWPNPNGLTPNYGNDGIISRVASPANTGQFQMTNNVAQQAAAGALSSYQSAPQDEKKAIDNNNNDNLPSAPASSPLMQTSAIPITSARQRQQWTAPLIRSPPPPETFAEPEGDPYLSARAIPRRVNREESKEPPPRAGSSSDSDSSSEEEELLSSSGSEDEEAPPQKQEAKPMSRFLKTAGGDSSSSDSDSDDSDDSDESDDEDGPKKSRFLKDAPSDESDSEEETKKVVKSAKDKRVEEMEAVIKTLDNASKISDWVAINTEFDKLTRLVIRLQTLNEPIPAMFIKTLVSLDDDLKSDKGDTKKKLNATNNRAMNGMRQKVKKSIRDWEKDVASYRENSEEFESKAAAISAAHAPGVAPTKPRAEKAAEAADADELGFATIGKAGKATDEPTITPETLFRHLAGILEARGKKNTDRTEQVRTLERLLKVASTPYSRIRVLLALISSRFDYNATNQAHIPPQSWIQARAEFDSLIDILISQPQYIVKEETVEYEDSVERKPQSADDIVEVRGSLVSFIERLDDEFTKTLQNSDPHSLEYVERLSAQKTLYQTTVKTQAYFELIKAELPVSRTVMRRLEHIYSKPDAVVEVLEKAASQALGQLKSTITPPQSAFSSTKLSDAFTHLSSQFTQQLPHCS